MKPPAFDYHRPTSIDEALRLLAEHGEDAKVLAGGQSLVPVIAMRLARPEMLIDIGAIRQLGGISRCGGTVSVGATTREAELERSPTVARHVPLLATATPLIGHAAIRNRGTLGGSIAHADPGAELPAVALALDAEIVARSERRGERTIRAGDFFQGFWTSALDADELLTEVRFPVVQPGTGVAFEEVARRHGDFALAGVGVSLTIHDGDITDARIVLIGVATTPIRAARAEAVLVGTTPSSDGFAQAADVSVDGLTPPSDLHGSGNYRRHVAAVLVRRALAKALAQTGGTA